MSAEKKHVLLVGLDVDNDKYSWLTNANASLMAALLCRPGASVAVHSPVRNVGCEEMESVARSVADAVLRRPHPLHYVGIGVYVWNDELVRRVLSLLSVEAPGIRRVLGGPQITYTPRGELERLYPHADLFIRGEAEEALPRLVYGNDRDEVPGVHRAGQQDRGDVAVIDDLSRLLLRSRTGSGFR